MIINLPLPSRNQKIFITDIVVVPGFPFNKGSEKYSFRNNLLASANKNKEEHVSVPNISFAEKGVRFSYHFRQRFSQYRNYLPYFPTSGLSVFPTFGLSDFRTFGLSDFRTTAPPTPQTPPPNSSTPSPYSV